MRAALYFRVSTEEQVEGYSLDAQSRAGRLYCEAHGWDVVAEYRDEGKSARTDDLQRRPAFSRMLDDAEAGRFDVIVVHKLDRFARNLRVTLETLDRLDKHGVAFVSISEQMDFTTPIGKVILATLGAFAQYYSDNLSTETKKGKHERKRQGYHNGLLPFGVKANVDGLAVPDPKTYPGLLSMFQSAAAGQSDRDVGVMLNEAGYRTTGNRGANLFTKDTVRRILTNRFYLGELPDGTGGWLPGKHAPLLDADLFEAAQAARAVNRHEARMVPAKATTYSLSGLGVCGHCGGKLHVQRAPSGRARVLCYQRNQSGQCPQRSVWLDLIEAQLADYLASFTIASDFRDQIMRLWARNQENRDDAATRRQQIDTRLQRLRDLYELGDLEREEYQRRRTERQSERALLKDDGDGLGAVLERVKTYLCDLPGGWEAATQEQRNRLLRTMLECVEITETRVTALSVRPEFAPFFALDCQARVGTCGSDGIRTRDLSLDRAAC